MSKDGNPETVQLLLDAGIAPDEGLAAASGSGHVDIIKLLLKAGADVNGKADDSPLFSAVWGERGAALETLLMAGANPNATDKMGSTPLHRATTGVGDIRVARLLVEEGARMDIANSEGITPIREASIRGAVDIYAWLLKQCDGSEPPPSNIEDDESVDTEELLPQLWDKDQEKRQTAQRLLVGRGERIMPAVLERIEATGLNSAFVGLFAAMGPGANKAIPSIDSLLDDEEQVFGALVTLTRMDPHNVEQLPAASRKRAAESLVKGIHKHTEDGYGPVLMGALVGLGEDATPQLLRFLEGDNPGLRAGAARDLQYVRFDSILLEKKLTDLLLHDPITGVREYAARGLQNPRFHSDEAKRALVDVLATPPIEIDAEPVHSGPEEARRKEERKKKEQEKQANESLIRQAAFALATFGPAIIPEIRDHLAQADEKIRDNYDDVYDQLGENPESISAFAKLLDDPNDAVRKSAHDQIGQLARHHIDEAGDLLIQRYSDGDPRAKQEAAQVLVRFRNGSQATRYLPHQLNIVGDAALDRALRMQALSSALNIDSEDVKQSKQAAKFVAILIDEIENGEYLSRIYAMRVVGELGSTAVSAKELLESLSSKPLPERPATLPKSFRAGIDDQPNSAYRKYTRERHAAERIRVQASESLKAIKADIME